MIQDVCREKVVGRDDTTFDLRERALARFEAGETIRSIGAALKISPSCVSKWRKLKTRTGSFDHGKIGGHKRPRLSGEVADWLRERCRLGGGVHDAWSDGGNCWCGGARAAGIWWCLFLHAEGLSFKTVLPAEQTRPDIARRRERWKAHEARIDPRRLVFDETWIKTNMVPLRG
ncbi:MAG: hypothetical protein JNK84_23095 [Phreatobacter sp.]|uniref:helix-turn-helix domain-containing protein n=1 Tax=Phreatobacter sp. TaxID=1966341 RepID=UPI001A3AD45F|nr:hypothetical protein [Phreatobacter sp.]MBL8571972.1 hypothetical protein [Phreatobacter sp.]